MDDEDDGEAHSTTTVSSYHRGKSSGGSNPCCNVCFGFALVFSGIALLGWNERRTVCQENALLSAEDSAVQASCNEPPTSYDGKLVFLSCPINQTDMMLYNAESTSRSNTGLKQAISGVRGLCFNQRMSIYQCAEDKSVSCTKRRDDGSCKKERTDFKYRLKYSSQFLDSREYCRNARDNTIVEDAKHAKQNACSDAENPTPEEFPYKISASAERPDSVKMGKWLLDTEQVHRLTAQCDSPVHPKKDSLGVFAQAAKQPPTPLDTTSMTTRGSGATLYSCEADAEAIGCITINFYTKTPEFVSLLYTVQETGFSTFKAPHAWLCGGEEVSHVQDGKVDLDHLFEMFHSTEKALRWGLRFLGFGIVFAGLYLIFSPLEWLAHKLPCIGDCVGGVVGCCLQVIEFVLALGISFITIAIVWVVMRPWVGIPLLIIGITLVALAVCSGKKKEKKQDDEDAEMGKRLVSP